MFFAIITNVRNKQNNHAKEIKIMKVSKKAEQKNVTLAKEYYTLDYINTLLETKEVFYLDDNFKKCYDKLTGFTYFENELRISTSNIEEIKVILDSEGFYTTVAIGKNGLTYFIVL